MSSCNCKCHSRVSYELPEMKTRPNASFAFQIQALWTLVSMGFTLCKCGWRDAHNNGEVPGSEREPLLGGQPVSRPGPSNVSHMIEVEGRMNRTK